MKNLLSIKLLLAVSAISLNAIGMQRETTQDPNAINVEQSAQQTQGDFKYQKLFQAIEDGDASVVTHLLSMNIDLNTTLNKDGKTPLTLAIFHANKRNFWHSPTEEQIEAWRRRLKIVELLVNNGANTNLSDSSGYSPLFYAWDEPNIIKFLLACGANPNALDERGRTPLIEAVENYNCNSQALSSAHELLEAGADPRIKDKSGHSARDTTPLAYLRAQKEHPELLTDKTYVKRYTKLKKLLEAYPKEMITLKDSENKTYLIPKAAALESSIIANMLQFESQEQQIPISDAISSETMDHICKILNWREKFLHVKGFHLILNALDQLRFLASLSEEQMRNIAVAGDFLGNKFIEELGNLGRLVTLKASDGQSFIAPDQAACKSKLIRDLLANPNSIEAQSHTITFKDINPSILEEIAKFFVAIQMKGEKNMTLDYELFTTMKKAGTFGDFEMAKLAALFNICDFLDCPIMVKVLVRTSPLRHDFTITSWGNREKVFGCLEAIGFRKMSDLLKREIARQYYLQHRVALPNNFIGEDSYGFSLGECLNNYCIRVAIKEKRTANCLDLSNLRLNNLDGLEKIENLDAIQVLDLRTNRFTELSIALLQLLPNLQEISLYNNPDLSEQYVQELRQALPNITIRF